jgi:hypothetical protein
MFARFRRVESHLQARLQVTVAESRRVAGRVRVEHIVALGSVGEPATIAERVAFWGNLHRRLDALSNRIGEDDRAKIIGAIYARIPMVTVDEQRALQRENAETDERLWSGLQDMNAEMAEGNKALAATASRKAAEAAAQAKDAAEKAAVAKERLDRLAKGEDVPGGLGKPFTWEDARKIMKGAGLTDDDIRFSAELARLCKRREDLFDAFVEQDCKLQALREKSDRWKVLRKIMAMREQ